MTTLLTGFLDRLKTLVAPRPVKLVGDQLYAACVAQSRLPVFYSDYGVEDEIGARFELLTLHVVILVTSLRDSGKVSRADATSEQRLDTAQTLFDAFLLALDTTLREQGTGDLTVPKKMKGIGKVVYTRLKHWDDLWTQDADPQAQADYIARTLYAGDGADESPSHVLDEARAVAAYVAQARVALDIDALLAGRATWPTPAALD